MLCQDKCIEECKWYASGKQLLRNNNINACVYAAALPDLLTNGRGKGRNSIIYGPANSKNTPILNPITTVLLSLLFLMHLLNHPTPSMLFLEQKKRNLYS